MAQKSKQPSVTPPAAKVIDNPQPNAGWVVKPIGGDTTLFMSKLSDGEFITPEVLGSIEQRLAEYRTPMMMTNRDCPKLKSCGSFTGSCPNLGNCGTYLD